MDCFTIDTSAPLTVRFPGGASVTGLPASPTPTPGDMARATVAALAGALAPLGAIFAVVQAVKAIADALQAIPSAISQLRPGLATDALADARGAVDALLSLVPAAALPVLVRDAVALLAAYAAALDAEIVAAAAADGSAARATAETLPEGPARDAVLAVADCQDQLVSDRIRAYAAAAGPVDSLVAVINTLAGVVGLPQLPSLGDVGGDPDAARESVAAFSTALETILSSIP